MKPKISRLTVIIIAALVVPAAALFLYFRIYGKNIFEAKLSGILERPVTFERFNLDLAKYRVVFDNFRIPNKSGFRGKSLFDAAKVTVILDKDRFKENKEAVFDRITIENATLYIERSTAGELNLADTHSLPGSADTAYAQSPKASPLYNFAKNVKHLTVKNSKIIFRDYGLYDVPFDITCDDFNAEVSPGTESAGSIPIECKAGLNIPSDRYNRGGEISLSARIDAYEYFADIDAAVKTRFIDLMRFYPYLEQYTPFTVREGIFSSNTSFKLQSNMIDSRTTMVFHHLILSVDPNKQNAKFLRTSVNKLAPYLTSQSGDIIFDFAVRGTPDNPRFQLGPHVQNAIGMAAMGEIGGFIQGLQKVK